MNKAMSKKDFGHILSILMEKYGKNHYPQSTAEWLFEELKFYCPQTLKFAVSELCATESYAPTVQTIKRFYGRISKPKIFTKKLTQDEVADVALFHERRCRVRVNQFIKNGITHDLLKKYYDQWCKVTLREVAQSEGYDENGRMVFYRIAIEDLFLSGGNPKKAYERAIKKQSEKLPEETFEERKRRLESERLLEKRDMQYFYESHTSADWA